MLFTRGGRGNADKRRRSTVALFVALAIGVTATIAVPSHADAAINAKSKAAVAAAYNRTLLPALATPVGWTGNAAKCSVGTESAASKKATLKAVNFMRGLVGVAPVTLNSTFSAKAQKAALVYAANGNLSHDIPKSWRCYSAAAHDAGAHSNIAWSSDSSLAGARAVLGYMDDPGAGNEAVGHRRWLLYPVARQMGTGSTANTNDLWVHDSAVLKGKKPKVNPKWVEWPASGYFPSQLEPNGRWSLTGNNEGTFNFSSAKVSVKGPGGKKLSVKKHATPKTAGYQGNDTLVFEVKGVKAPLGTKKVSTYTVKVTGIKRHGSKKKISYSYKVRMFDPTS